jgi:hypothetical protein
MLLTHQRFADYPAAWVRVGLGYAAHGGRPGVTVHSQVSCCATAR